MNATDAMSKAPRPLWVIVLLLFLFLVAAVVVELRTPASSIGSVAFDEAGKMSACRTSAIQMMKPASIDAAMLYQISDLCYTEVRREYLLGNFNIHRYNIVKQEFQTLVVMWMVVTITMSGVFLAGVQLLAAYRLASSGQGELAGSNDLSIERGKISLKSSVTGLLILTVSLAFFIVYVKWVYALTPDQYATEASSPLAPSTPVTAPTINLLPGIGHAGLPPAQASSAAGLQSPGSVNVPRGDAPASVTTPTVSR
jgi:hypothetical protein